MGVLDVVPVGIPQCIENTHIADSIQAGVLTGDNVRKLFDYAKENGVSRILLSFPISNSLNLLQRV